jgi:hypothetical protein
VLACTGLRSGVWCSLVLPAVLAVFWLLDTLFL